jgi:hypothetical protein
MNEKQQTLFKLYWDLPLPGEASLKIQYEGSVFVACYKEFMDKVNAIMPIVLETIFAASGGDDVDATTSTSQPDTSQSEDVDPIKER